MSSQLFIAHWGLTLQLSLPALLRPRLHDTITWYIQARFDSVILVFCSQSMLRGRGGCYKHTFYGIESHRCMETTPSLACANKCVFCWRSVLLT